VSDAWALMTALKLTRSGRKVKCHAADLGGNAWSTERRASMAQIHLQLKGKTCSEYSHFWERSILLSTELIVTRLARMHVFCNRASEVTLTHAQDCASDLALHVADSTYFIHFQQGARRLRDKSQC